MARATHGPEIKKRAKRLLESIVQFSLDELDDCGQVKVKCSWIDDRRLRVQAKLRDLVELTACNGGDGLQKTEVGESLNRMKDFMGILEDERLCTQGSEDWQFTLTLWSKETAENLLRFEAEWENRRPSKSKGVMAEAQIRPAPSDGQSRHASAEPRGANPTLCNLIIDEATTISEKTDGFVGRQFVFDSIADFTHNNSCGYFIVKGVPGIGKSSLAAQLVKTGGYVHHFNSRGEGISTPKKFLENICAQLIVSYQLDYEFLPSNATDDSRFLKKILNEVSDKLDSGKKAIITVDALDEVDNMPRGANILYLPKLLPSGVFVIAMTRDTPITLQIDCQKQTLYLEEGSNGNIADVKAYIEQSIKTQGIKKYIEKQGLSRELFTKHLVDKSQGNFMYLRYVLPEIDKGTYKDLKLDKLPDGLIDYYECHVQRMRGENEDDWFKYKLPIIMALAVAEESISVDLIADYSKVHDRNRIHSVLKDCQQFLHEGLIKYEGNMKKVYRFYHASFHDYIDYKGKEDESWSCKNESGKLLDQWMEGFGNE
jgi:hypothetical protein